jgi:Arm DNA-binding domain
MASLLRGRKGYLLVQFYYQRQLCREYLGLPDTRDNRRDQKEFLRKLEAAHRLGTFQYTEFSPVAAGCLNFKSNWSATPSSIISIHTSKRTSAEHAAPPLR